jgi:hypothetical protein
MCNDYRLMVDVASIVEDFADLKIKIHFGEGAPNLEARQDIKITDVAQLSGQSRVCAMRVSSCNGAGAGQDGTSVRCTIFCRKEESSRPIAA